MTDDYGKELALRALLLAMNIGDINERIKYLEERKKKMSEELVEIEAKLDKELNS